MLVQCYNYRMRTSQNTSAGGGLQSPDLEDPKLYYRAHNSVPLNALRKRGIAIQFLGQRTRIMS
jgi:hypothetical protein